jgi:hypothetical protein
MATQSGMTELQKATQAYEDIASNYEAMNKKNSVGYGYEPLTPSKYTTPGAYSTPGGALVTIGAPPGGVQGQSTDITGIRSSGGRGYGQVSQMGASSASQQKYTPVEFKKPGKFKAPEYAPPERDLGEERQLRREYMAPGMAQIRRTTQQAVISSKSMDNPNARALFINKALQGVGSALEKVTTGASTQARAESMQRYNTELEKYYTGWKSKMDEAKINWDADWNSAVLDFNQMVKAQLSGMNVSGLPGSGGGNMNWQSSFKTPQETKSILLGM